MKTVRLPGLIDIHVHLRDPGETQKEDFYSGTKAALAGGITAIFDMPNNAEPTFTLKALEEKTGIARQKAVCDWGLYFGSLGENISEFAKASEKAAGLKVYLSQTTGKYVVGDDWKAEQIVKNWPKEKIIVFHAEGKKVDLIIKLLEKYKNKIHLTHVSTKESLEKIIEAKKNKLPVTCDVTPHHLFLSKSSKVLYANVKPALATEKDRLFLWENLKYVDCLVSDHAPHLISEKNSNNPPAGVPGLETMLPLMLKAVSKEWLSLSDVLRLMHEGPRQIFNLKPSNDTYIEIDPDEEYLIENSKLMTKCGWSPYNGWSVKGRVKRVFLRGTKVFDSGRVLVDPGFGQKII